LADFVCPKIFEPEASINPAPAAAVAPMNSRRVNGWFTIF
jgi:hypothetical protein